MRRCVVAEEYVRLVQNSVQYSRKEHATTI